MKEVKVKEHQNTLHRLHSMISSEWYRSFSTTCCTTPLTMLRCGIRVVVVMNNITLVTQGWRRCSTSSSHTVQHRCGKERKKSEHKQRPTSNLCLCFDARRGARHPQPKPASLLPVVASATTRSRVPRAGASRRTRRAWLPSTGRVSARFAMLLCPK